VHVNELFEPRRAVTPLPSRIHADTGGAARDGRLNTSCSVASSNGRRGHTSRSAEAGQVKLTLDLHEIYNRGDSIDRALRDIIDQAVAKRATLVEIIPGKGSGQLKKRVLRFLDQKDVKALYHRIEKDSHNFGRVFVHFHWK
jgi:DNA-nicking Smr family endonuclease